MKNVLDERSLDWALAHLSRFCDNDCFPAAFEFQVFAENWNELRNHILAIDLDSHVPRPPLVPFAPKLTGSFRIVHRLDPIDSLVYTALVHEVHEALQKTGGPASEGLISSLRVEPAADGSLFSTGRSACAALLADRDDPLTRRAARAAAARCGQQQATKSSEAGGSN